mmetsp:Transcript_80927/g.262316  ORF Transcript_80927/g.262316 Transcript_80927/m.262316 type:complete len:345 (+) Transcript_80927:763-1797(+)
MARVAPLHDTVVFQGHKPRTVVQDIARHDLAEPCVPGVAGNPHEFVVGIRHGHGRCRGSAQLKLGPALATPTRAASTPDTSIVLELVPILDACRNAPKRLLLLGVRVGVAFPRLVDVRNPLHHPLCTCRLRQGRRRRLLPSRSCCHLHFRSRLAPRRRGRHRLTPRSDGSRRLIPRLPSWHCLLRRRLGASITAPRLAALRKLSILLHLAVLGHGDVADDCITSILALTSPLATRRRVHPRHGPRIATPVCDAQAHAIAHRIAQLGEVLAVAIRVLKHHLTRGLPQRRPHTDEQASGILKEFGLHIERFAGIDREGRAWAICIFHVSGVLRAATPIAKEVVAID